MANNGSFNTNGYNGSSTVGNRYLTFSWSVKEQDIATNKTVISWTLKGAGGNSGYYYIAGNFKVNIDGETVYSSSRRIELYSNTVVATGEKTLYHNDDGKRSFSAYAEAGIYAVAVNCEGEGEWTLPTIARYGTITQSLNTKTETTIKINWSSDKTIDGVWYSIDNGSTWKWVTDPRAKSGNYTISGLSANTTYKIKTRIKTLDSQLYTDSSALSVTTYDYPYCTDSPNFVLGDLLTLKFYNPLSRAFKFYIIGNGTQIDTEYNCSSTSYTGVNHPASSVPYLYNTIPNAKSGRYKVKVVYENSTKTRDNGNTYSIVEKDCYPTFSNFTYKDTNGTVTAVTGSDQIIVKGKSRLAVYISSANKMSTKNGATPKRYSASIDAITQSKNHSTSDITIDVGTVASSGVKRLSVRAYDSRELSMLAYKDVTIYDYKEPIINVNIERYNNYEAQTTLKVSGTYSRLTVNNADKNTITKVEYRFRETGGSWSGWSPLTTTLNSGKFTCNDVTLTLDNQKSFEFEIKVIDKLTDEANPTTKTATVDVGQAVFFISSNKKKCFINGEEVTTNDNVKQIKYYTQLAENTDLNSIINTGTYRSLQASHSATMQNVPTGIDGGFTLHVLTWTSRPDDTTYRRQELIYGRMTYVRRSIDGGATWSAWNTTAYIEDLYPVGAVYCNSTNTNPSAKFGGTWELIDKGFKSGLIVDSSAFTPNSKVGVTSCYITHGYQTIRIRLIVTLGISPSDEPYTIGNFNWDKVGIVALPMGFDEMVTFDDGANGGIVWSVTWNTGQVTQTDVTNGIGITEGKSFSLELTFTVPYSRMLDSFCDKFYWKRTA